MLNFFLNYLNFQATYKLKDKRQYILLFTYLNSHVYLIIWLNADHIDSL